MRPVALIALLAIADPNCDTTDPTDKAQAIAQQQALEQAHAAVGMPAIQNWQEKRMVKDLYELRDKAIATHVYLFSEVNGCLVYLGPSVGYGIPYATQFSSPEKDIYASTSSSYHHNMPQAEPNGLFMPANAEGTWIMLKDPASADVKAVYAEPRVIVSPFRIPDSECKPQPPAAKAAK